MVREGRGGGKEEERAKAAHAHTTHTYTPHTHTPHTHMHTHTHTHTCTYTYTYEIHSACITLLLQRLHLCAYVRVLTSCDQLEMDSVRHRSQGLHMAK